jgi:hypothetical protein
MTRANSESESPLPATECVPAAAQAFAAFSFILALLAVASFWPPTSLAVIGWLTLWVGVCVATGAAILLRLRHAVSLVWSLTALATLSAILALQSGMLDATGIVIDILLFVPLFWFAFWYQTRRSARAKAGRGRGMAP